MAKTLSSIFGLALPRIEGARASCARTPLGVSMNALKRFSRCVSGATAIEYGIIVALIAMAAIISIQLLGINLADTFWTLANVIGA
jgi:pilus assembly protein Flp/PilA